MALVELARTESFLIQFDPSFASAERRAAALAETIERDFAVLRGWFDVHGGFGPDDRCTVNCGSVHGGIADNDGYNSGGNSIVELTTLDDVAADDVRMQALADDAARGMWVAEMAEVLMDYNNQQSGRTTWDRGASNGEGLSMACLELFYPAAAYTPLLGFPDASDWYGATPRPDWVSTTEPTDGNFVSSGCALAFIFFLISQLSHTPAQVIQAGEPTLEETFHRLTGMHGGFDAMEAVLEPFFPPGATQPRTDDPFPLFTDASHRSVQLRVSDQVLGRVPAAPEQTMLTLPFPCRGEVLADYTPFDFSPQLTVEATTVGFANPEFSWYLGGHAGDPTAPDVDAAFVGHLGGPIAVEQPVTPNDPRTPHAAPSSQRITLQASPPASVPPPPRQQAASSILQLTLPPVQGTIDLTISCTVSDHTRPQEGLNKARSEGHYQTRSISWSDDWLDQSNTCRERATALFNHQLPSALRHRILPDPPLEFTRAMQTLRLLLAELDKARAQDDQERISTLAGLMRDYLDIPKELLPSGVLSPEEM
jgi:hypothetical protein